MSTLKTTNLQHASAASPAIVLASDSTATLNGLAYPTSGSLSGRNRIINGAMMVDARNAGAAFTVANGSTAYTLDRWIVYSGGSSMSVQRVGSPGAFSLQMTGAAGNTGSQLIQRIEALNIGDLAGQVVTLSFTISSSSLTTVGAFYNTPTSTDNFNSLNATQTISGAIPVTSTPTRQSVSFTLPASAVNGLGVFLQTGAFTAGTLTVTNLQLEAGSVATPFERRSYGQELALCQRYYEKGSIPVNGLVGQYSPNAANSGTAAGFSCNFIPFVVTKRTTPSVPTITTGSEAWTIAANTNVTAYSAHTFTAVTISENAVRFVSNRISGGTTPTTASMYVWEGTFNWTASAEL